MKSVLKKSGFALLFLLVGIFIGGAIVGLKAAHSVERVVWADRAPVVEEMIERRIEEKIAEEIVIGPDIRIPPIPEMPQRLEMPVRIVQRGPSFWQIISGIANFFTAVFLIVIGVVVLMRRQRQPKEKQP